MTTTSGIECYDLSLNVYILIYLFLEMRREGERDHRWWLPLTHPLPGTWPAAQAWDLTRNRTDDPSVRKPALNLPSHTSQGSLIFFLITQSHYNGATAGIISSLSSKTCLRRKNLKQMTCCPHIRGTRQISNTEHEP